MSKKPEKEAKKPGRQSTFSETIAQEICNRIADGEPLRQICRDEGMPPWRTVYEWLEKHPDFAARFARAREVGFDAIAEDCLDIADETVHDTIETENGDRPNTEWLSRSKLRIETRLKLLAKWDPKRYGDKMAIGGAADLPPIDTKTTLDVTGLSTAALAEIMAAKDDSEQS